MSTGEWVIVGVVAVALVAAVAYGLDLGRVRRSLNDKDKG